jgi:tetratricopeptide (TPR) repeat protein
MRLRPLLTSAAVACLVAALPLHAASDLGKVDFPTSAAATAPAAQAHFLRGVAALHSFWYDEAADEFRAAQKAAPGFALAYWGEAMTFNHPVWGEEDLDGARGALARLAATREERLAKAPDERERAWLDAAETLYGAGEKAERDRAYAEAMRRLHERWPDDLEAGAFYALSLIGPTLVTDGATFGEPREQTLMRAAALLEELFVRNPEHPGVVHYLIHAYDDPVHAPLGLRAARAYARVAPAAHHALHMPSHIFVQLGRWADVTASNEASWAASVAWVKRRGLPVDKEDFHSLSWLAYSYLQQGRYAKARETLDLARAEAKRAPSPRLASIVGGMEARYVVETGAWSEARLPKVEPGPAAVGDAGKGGAAHCGGKPDPGSGPTIFAAALAAAERGDAKAAADAVALLRAVPAEGRYGYGPDILGILVQEIDGVAQIRTGHADEGLKLLGQAAAAEEAMTPPSGPPDLLAPAMELYGRELLAAGRPEEAARQFERSLRRMPNRTASLLGAARAAERLGRHDEAQARYAALREIWKGADAGVPGVGEAAGN